MVVDIGKASVVLSGHAIAAPRSWAVRAMQQHKWGYSVIAFGLGLLIGSFLTLQFLLILVALFIIAIGFLLLRIC